MREGYETPADRSNEQRIMDLAALKWSCRYEKLPDRYWVDYILFKAFTKEDIPVGFVEIKKRHKLKITTFPEGLYLPMQKYWFGKQIAKEADVPFIFINELDDGIFYATIEGDYSMKWSGPKEARDSQDREPEMLITGFKKL